MIKGTDLMRECIPLLVFAKDNCETEEDKKNRDKFQQLLRKQHLQNKRKQRADPTTAATEITAPVEPRLGTDSHDEN